jgi:hypothetical protein
MSEGGSKVLEKQVKEENITNSVKPFVKNKKILMEKKNLMLARGEAV